MEIKNKKALMPGAQIKNKVLLCFAGDGSFQMTLTELAISIRENIKVIVVVFNNYYLGMVRQWQDLFYRKRFSGTALTLPGGHASAKTEADPSRQSYVPDFVKLAEAYGARGIRISKNEQVETAFREALKERRTVVIEALIHPSEKVFPMIPAGG